MVNRREVLQATAAAGVGMVATDLVHAAPSAAVPTKVQIPEAEKIVVTVITDNLADINRLDYKIAKRLAYGASPLEATVHAEHGLSYHVETFVSIRFWGRCQRHSAQHRPAQDRSSAGGGSWYKPRPF